MFPSSLVVTIRRYPVSGSYGFSGPHAGVGAEERKLLADAGIESYVKLDRIGSVALANARLCDPNTWIRFAPEGAASAAHEPACFARVTDAAADVSAIRTIGSLVSRMRPSL